MKFKKLSSNNKALAGVIEALLIVALVAIIIAFIQQVYVPEIMKQKESDHMDQVANQFANLKSVIEIQAMTGADSDTQLAYTPISSPITLGSGRLPYFITTGASGSIQVFGENDVNSKIVVNDPHPDFLNGIPLTSIKYTSQNYYFNNSNYINEAGGIILIQEEVEEMRINPAITVQNLSNEIKINFFLPIFLKVPGKDQDSGFKDSFIRTNFSNAYSTHEDTNTDSINIYSEYLDAWYFSLNNETTGFLREYIENGYIDILYNEGAATPYIEISPGSKQIHLILDVVDLGVQIGPGFVT
jgi:hypothetical protein